MSELMLRCKEGDALRRLLHSKVLDLAEVVRMLADKVRINGPPVWHWEDETCLGTLLKSNAFSTATH